MLCLNASKSISILRYITLEIGFLSAAPSTRKLQSVFLLFLYLPLSSPLSPIIYKMKGLEGSIPTINKNSINMPLALADVESAREKRGKRQSIEGERERYSNTDSY